MFGASVVMRPEEFLEGRQMTDEDPAKLESFDARLKAARGKDAKPEANSGQLGAESSMGYGTRISMEMLVAPLVGMGFGYALDRWLGTKPLFLLVLMFLGLVAGVINVIRVTKRMDRQQNGDMKDN
jgi:ATP synthase protein I